MKEVADIEPVNLTPMIDIVFQMIIFFVLTVDLDKMKLTDETKLGKAPDGEAVEDQQHPRTINIEVNKNGTILLASRPLSVNQLKGILKKTVKQHGQSVPVVVWGDYRTQHGSIRRVLDAVSECGLWKISLAAVQKESS